MISFSEALELLFSNKINLGTETVSILDASNSTLAEDLVSDRDYPPFNRSAMDGYAVSSQWYNALDKKAMVSQGNCFAGAFFEKEVDSTRCIKIMTGAPVPEGLDAVIKIEDSIGGCDLIEFQPKEIKPFENIAQKGEDAKNGEKVLAKGTLLTPANLQLVATLGYEKVTVFKQPTVSIITTGDEVKDIGDSVDWFQIRNSNKYSLLLELKNFGIEVKSCVHVKDTEKQLKEEVEKASEADITILTGGVSMGEADYVPSTLKSLGVEQVFHKIAMKPGKPVWFGKGNNKVVFGLPGNPLSTFNCLHLLLKPYLKSLNNENYQLEFVDLSLKDDLKPGRIDRFFPFELTEGKANIKKFNGSGDVTATLDTIGLAYLPKGEELKSGDLVKCLFY